MGIDRLPAFAGRGDPALRVADRAIWGTWIASIALFAVGSGLCALATSAGELIAFRILQGLGGGMLMPVGFNLIAQSAGPQRVGRALGVVGVPILLGPIIGGLIVDNASWQWIFVVNVPIAGAAILLAAREFRPDAGRADAVARLTSPRAGGGGNRRLVGGAHVADHLLDFRHVRQRRGSAGAHQR